MLVSIVDYLVLRLQFSVLIEKEFNIQEISIIIVATRLGAQTTAKLDFEGRIVESSDPHSKENE